MAARVDLGDAPPPVVVGSVVKAVELIVGARIRRVVMVQLMKNLILHQIDHSDFDDEDLKG